MNQSTSIAIDWPSPLTSALRPLLGTLIFSNPFSVDADSTAIGSTSLTDVDLATNFFVRCARRFSRATAILLDRDVTDKVAELGFGTYLCFQNACSLRRLISATRFIALTVVCTSSRS